MNQSQCCTGIQVELVIPREVWDSTMRPLLVDHGRHAFGSVRWHRSKHSSEALIDQLVIVDEIPDGHERSPLTDWLLLTVRHAGDPTLDERALQFTRRASQRVILLEIDAAAPGNWDAVVLESHTSRKVWRVRVVGPDPLTLRRDSFQQTERLIHDLASDSGRWDRLSGALSPRVVGLLHSAEVTVAGASRGGSQIALNLGQLGVPHLRLVDKDVVEPHNRDGMPVPPDAVGQPKVEALARTLLHIHPELSIVCVDQPLNDPRALLQMQGRQDAVFSFVDSSVGHLAASELSRHRLAAHIAVGSSVHRDDDGKLKLEGDVRVLLPGPTGGCVACVGGLPDPDGTLDYELARPPGTLHRGRPRPWNADGRAGSLITLNALCAATAVQHWLDVLIGRRRTSCWTRIDWTHEEGPQFQTAPVSADPDCPFCGPSQSSSEVFQPLL